MFSVRVAPPHHESFMGRRPNHRHTLNPFRLPRQPTPEDSRLLQDLTGTFLSSLLGSMTGQPTNRCCGQRNCPQKNKKWVHRLNLRGYGPDDVTITTREGRVFVKARRVEGDGDSSDVYESNRVVPIPDGVDARSMKSHFAPEGLLTIEAKFTTKEEKKDVQEVHVREADDVEVPLTQEEMVDNLNERDSDKDSQLQSEQPASHIKTEQDIMTGEQENHEEVLDYSESVDSFLGTADFTVIEGDVDNSDVDHDYNGAELTINEHSASDIEHAESRGDTGCPIEYEDDRLVKQDEGKLEEIPKKEFKLSFSKDDFGDGDVTVLHKGNSLLVKSQKKAHEDGMTRTEYHARHFTLPDDLDTSQLSCSKSSDGEIIVRAPYQN